MELVSPGRTVWISLSCSIVTRLEGQTFDLYYTDHYISPFFGQGLARLAGKRSFPFGQTCSVLTRRSVPDYSLDDPSYSEGKRGKEHKMLQSLEKEWSQGRPWRKLDESCQPLIIDTCTSLLLL